MGSQSASHRFIPPRSTSSRDRQTSGAQGGSVLAAVATALGDLACGFGRWRGRVAVRKSQRTAREANAGDTEGEKADGADLNREADRNERI